MRTRKLWLFWMGACVTLALSACAPDREIGSQATATATSTPRSPTATLLPRAPTPLPTYTSVPAISGPTLDTPDPPATPTADQAGAHTVPDFQVEAWLSRPKIASGDEQRVYGRLSQDGVGVAGAQMYSFLRYPDIKLRSPSSGFETTGADGIASSTFVVRGGTAGRTVYVDVYLTYEGEVYRGAALFLTEG